MKSISFVILLTVALVFIALPSYAIQRMGSVAIFTEAVSWTDVGTANNAAQKIINGLKLTRDIEILSDKAIGDFAKNKTNDGFFDIVITFGYFPVSLYSPGNGKPDGSIGEEFLEGGDMFINTADYIFYVTQGGGANGDTGLKNMTDSTFDMWTDGTVTEPTDLGKQYTPSLVKFTAPRCFKISQVESNDEWEMEAVFGSNGADHADPAIIRNTEYDGRVGIVFQSGDALPRAEVIIEMIDNWLGEQIKAQAVEADDKLSSTWGKIKRSL